MKTTNTLFLTRTLITLSILLLSSCGGGTSGTSGGFDSGYGKSNELRVLTDTEKSNLCETARNHIAETYTEETVCRLFGVFTAILFDQFSPENTDDDSPNLQSPAELCQEIENSCRSQSGVSPFLASYNSQTKESCAQGGEFQESIKDCTATIATYEACIAEQKVLYTQFYEEVTCNAINAEFLASINQSTGEPTSIQEGPACAALYQQCPKLKEVNNS
jgi:hypothetical protein